MASNLKLANETVSASANAKAALLNDGYLRIYDGSQPANANAGVGGATLLAELRFGNPAFASAVDGVATANAITDDASANATGTATWFRALKSDGSSPVMDGNVATSGADCNINATEIVAGRAVSCVGMTITDPKNA